MIVNLEKTILVICPICGEIIENHITPFDVMSVFDVKCPVCKNVAMKIEYTGGEYKITQNCFICDTEHVFKTGYNAMWKKGIFSFGCSGSGLDICYIGEEDAVQKAMETLEIQLENMMKSIPQPQITELSGILKDAFNLLDKLLTDGKIICLCGEGKIGAFITSKGITLTCATCGSVEVIKMQSDEDLQKLKKRKSILLR